MVGAFTTVWVVKSPAAGRREIAKGLNDSLERLAAAMR
jgi:hypothetical protein